MTEILLKKGLKQQLVNHLFGQNQVDSGTSETDEGI